MPISATGYDFENDYKYTDVRVKDRDSGRSFVVKMVNSKIKTASGTWTVKDGKVYDSKGKTLKDNQLELARYQAQFVEAAAGAGDNASAQKLNVYDLVGAAFKGKLEASLQNGKSEFHVTDADALEHGVFYGSMKNQKGETREMTITLLDDKPSNPVPKKEAFNLFKPSTWF
ncbi:hypothetical protein IJ541_10105 [bacterium]|nr:hypothetical protein [bacterium]